MPRAGVGDDDGGAVGQAISDPNIPVKVIGLPLEPVAVRAEHSDVYPLPVGLEEPAVLAAQDPVVLFGEDDQRAGTFMRCSALQSWIALFIGTR